MASVSPYRRPMTDDDPTGWRTAGRSVLDAAGAVGGFIARHPPAPMAPSLPAIPRDAAIAVANRADADPHREQKNAVRTATQAHADAVATQARTAPAVSPQPPAGAGTPAPGKPGAPEPGSDGRIRAVKTPDGRTVHTNLPDSAISKGGRPGTAFVVGSGTPQPYSEQLAGLAALGPRLGPGATADQINDSMNWSRYIEGRQQEERASELTEEQQRAASAKADYERRQAEIDPLEAARIAAESRYMGDEIKANAEMARHASAAKQVERYAAAIAAARRAGDEATAKSLEFALRAYLSAYGTPMPVDRPSSLFEFPPTSPTGAPQAGAPKG